MNNTPHSILVVDDEPTNRKLLKYILRANVYRFFEAGTGHEALAIVRENVIDIVLLDLMMPGMDGFQVLEQMRTDTKLRNIPVIIASALNDMQEIERGLRLGAMDYFCKPLSEEVRRFQLPLKVENLIRLKIAQQQAMEMQKMSSLSVLAAGAAHELNNPLTGIIGMAQLMLQDASLISRESLEMIYQEGVRCESIIRKLMMFARQFKPKKSQVGLKKLLEEIIADSVERRSGEDSKISLHFNANTSCYVTADAPLLQQAFQQLIRNALEATVANNGKVMISCWQTESALRIEICDQGPGIPEDNLPHIFDPFFTTKETGEGSGLGLSICHGIIKEHGGQIYAHNNPDRGSMFVVELPVAEQPSES